MQNDKMEDEAKTKLEKMSDFFTSRIGSYEEHMLDNGGIEGYKKLAELVPARTGKILDLGCGTGLELDEIFKRLPHVSVVGIDLTPVMLDKLKQKYPDNDLNLICGDYFSVELGKNIFDTAISFQSMHHFSHQAKLGLYRRVHEALKSNGVYIEGDYMLTDQSLEDELMTKNTSLRQEIKYPLR